MKYAEGVEVYDQLKEKVDAIADGPAKRAVIRILDQHFPQEPYYGATLFYGFAECGSDDCYVKAPDGEAVFASWPCSAVQPILSAFDE